MASPTLYRLQTLKVADVMSKDVHCVSPHHTVSEAANLLCEREISGAPVVDEQDHCVGMLTALDFVRRASSCDQSDLTLGGADHKLIESREEPLHIETTGEETVDSYMSPAVQSIGDYDSLLEAARRMCAGHIHRMPVLDENGHVLGIITSLDVVAAVVNAIEEERQ